MDLKERRTFCYTSLPFVSKVSVVLASDLKKKQYTQNNFYSFHYISKVIKKRKPVCHLWAREFWILSKIHVNFFRTNRHRKVNSNSLQKFGIHKHFLFSRNIFTFTFGQFTKAIILRARVYREWIAEMHQFIKKNQYKNTFINYLLLWTSLSGPYWRNIRSNGLLRNTALVIFCRFIKIACG